MTQTEFSLSRVPAAFVRPTIEQYHYLRRWPDPRSLPFAYALSVDGKSGSPDGRPWGIVVFKKLQHHKQLGLFGEPGLPTAWQVLDLARVWVHPSLQPDPLFRLEIGCATYPAHRSCKNHPGLVQPQWLGTDRSGRPVVQHLNIFSRMVAMALRTVQRDWIEHHPPVYPDLPYHIELILSYCDRKHHQGVGYRAANFTRWGQTSDLTKDIYIRRLRRPSWKHVGTLFTQETLSHA